MAEVITVPKMSEDMIEVTVKKWFVKVGDKVKAGDILAEVETDKATMELENYEDGVILYISKPKRNKIPIDGWLAIIGEENEDISSLLDQFDEKSYAAKGVNISTIKVQSEVELPLWDNSCSIIVMPAFGGMRENQAIISRWLVKEGDVINENDVLAEVEVDKAIMELVSYETGKVLYLAPLNTPIFFEGLIAIMGDDDANIQPIIAHFKEWEASQKPKQAVMQSKGGFLSFLRDLLPPYR